MKQKKILFVCNNLNHGGIPRALVNLLQEIAGSCEIDLLLFYPSGSYLTQVPESVRILHGEGLLPLLGIPQADLQRTPAWEFFGPEDCICFCAGAVRI
mgnify:CR=1 FL=1